MIWPSYPLFASWTCDHPGNLVGRKAPKAKGFHDFYLHSVFVKKFDAQKNEERFLDISKMPAFFTAFVFSSATAATGDQRSPVDRLGFDSGFGQKMTLLQHLWPVNVDISKEWRLVFFLNQKNKPPQNVTYQHIPPGEKRKIDIFFKNGAFERGRNQRYPKLHRKIPDPRVSVALSVGETGSAG